MFDIGWSEFIVIGVVALIAIGPKELPTVLRTCGQWMGKIRRMASEFQGQFQEAMREAEMADLKKHVDDIAETASSFSNFDPIGTIRKEVESITGDKLPEAPHESPPAPPIGAPPAEPEMAAAQGAAHETPHAGETPAAFETTSPVEAPPPAAAAPEPTSPPHAAAASEPAPPSWTPKPGEGA